MAEAWVLFFLVQGTSLLLQFLGTYHKILLPPVVQ